MRILEPRYYSGCPLGLDSSMCQPDPDWLGRAWWRCPNADYCEMATQAWLSPLYRSPGCWIVKLRYREPHGYSAAYYRKMMREYGWAEAEDLIFRRLRSDYSLRVVRNKFLQGYAIAVNLGLWERQNLNCYRQDSQGLWWHAEGNSFLPKDSSDERWQRLAKKN